MKIHCNKENLAQGVQTIQSALSARTTLPILLNFLLETENSRVKVVSTDLEMGVKHYIGAEVENAGSITIPARKFSDILHSLPDNEDIELSVDGGGRIQVKCGRSRFGIVGAPKSEYPILPEFNKQNAFEIPVGLIGEMVKKTIFAASSDETRHVLNGVFWSAKKGVLEMVSTDGRRLALAIKKAAPKEKDFQVIVPTKILSELLKLLNFHELKADSTEKMLIGVTENQIAFQLRDTTLLSRLVGGSFPRYEQVIPQKTDFSVTLDTKEFLAVTKRASLCAVDRGGSVKYSLRKGALQVTASSQNLDFNDEMSVEYAGDEFHVAFNPAFIIDALKHVDTAKVKMSMTTAVNPALLEPVGDPDCRFVVMPMRA
ncbi:MAG: DNA polymerase III subunit beta [Elusimicrobia bacterium]|nr:DNA polymerase III subunit beta [Elusimicrobiota bacterium]